MAEQLATVKIEKLTGNNYASWKYNVQLVLMQQGLWGLTNGTEACPDIKEEDKNKDDSVKLLKAWQLRCDKAYSIIALNVEKSIQVYIQSTTDAKKAWKILKDHFEISTVPHVVRLSRRFFAAVMGENEDVFKFITRMTTLAQELRDCGEDISTKKLATTVLGALPPSYDNFLTSFNTVSMNDVNWDNVKSLLIEEYMKRKDRLNRNSDQDTHFSIPNSSDDALFTNSLSSNRGSYYGGSSRGGRGIGSDHYQRYDRQMNTHHNSQTNDDALFTNSSYSNNNNSRGNYRGGASFRGGRGGSRGRGGRGGFQQQRNNTHPYNNNVGNRSFQGQCFKCGHYGHRINDCPERNIPEQGFFVADEGQTESNTSHNFFHEEDLALSVEFVEDDRVKTEDNSSQFFHEEDVALSTVFRDDDHSTAVRKTGEWYIDSAATRHMTYEKDNLMDFRLYSPEEKAKSKVHLGDNSVISAVGEGKVRLATGSNENCTYLALQSVAYVPELTKNLLSVPAMANMGAEVRFNKDKCVVVKGGKKYSIGHLVGGKLYCVGDSRHTNDTACYTSVNKCSSKDIWHQRFGHLNSKDVDKLSKCSMVIGMKVTEELTSNSEVCEGCVLGKMTKRPFPKKSRSCSLAPLELVHTDLCGPMQEPSQGGSRYVLTFTDDYSRYTTVYFLRNKSDTITKFKDYVRLMENSSGQKIRKLSIKTLRSDNGGEYLSKEFTRFCNENGINREFTNPETPEQNGVAERFNRTMIESARSMLYHAKLPLSFWAEAVSTAVYIRNRSPTTSLVNKTPFECWFQKKPDVSHMRVFGSLCYVHIPDSQRRKLDAKSYKGIFVGYPEGTKGYKIYNLTSGKFVKTRNVMFDENHFHTFDTPIPKVDEIIDIILPDDESHCEFVHRIDDMSINDQQKSVVDNNVDSVPRNAHEIPLPPPLPVCQAAPVQSTAPPVCS